jgi:aldehyde dehydrogenase (NAD+)
MEALSELSPALGALLGSLGSCIGGGWITDGDGEIEVLDPTTERVIARVPRASTSEIRTAVGAARQAFDEGAWPRLRPRDRQRLLLRLAERIEAYGEELAELGVLEGGTPISVSRRSHAATPVRFFEWWADMALRGPHGRWEDGLGLSHERTLSASILFNEPIGVVGAITAYNFPLMTAAFKVGGALAAGCTTVIVPSPRTPLMSIAFMRIAEEVEFPPGVLNLVIGDGDVGRALTTDEGVDLISFTGSVEVGRKVMTQAAAQLKKVVLELGGKSPNLLLPSSKVDHTAAPTIQRFTNSSGQTCGSVTRILVPRNQYDAFIDAASACMEALVVGDPSLEQTQVGPLIRGDQVLRVEGYVERALAAGAEVVASSCQSQTERGFFSTPRLLGGLDNWAEVCQEELFGPVAVVLPYDSVDEAIQIANETRYGLNASIWGQTDEAMLAARRIRSGTVALNGGGPHRPDAPWGGFGESGVGHELGEAGFAEFFQVKHVHWPLGGTGGA